MKMNILSKITFAMAVVVSVFYLFSCGCEGDSDCSDSSKHDDDTCTSNDDHDDHDVHDHDHDGHNHEKHWAYDGETGPTNWSKEFADCAGTAQSPIDITEAVKDGTLADIDLTYNPYTELFAVNNGHSVQVNYPDGALKIDGKVYNLLQFHFHCPSEHTINGERFAMEIHLVHGTTDKKLAVIGIMVKEGVENEFFENLFENLPTKEGEEVKKAFEFDVNKILPASMGYYTYDGSLTTPPCSEGVKWLVLKTPIKASKAQLEKLISMMPKDNYRPVQDLNERVINEK